MRSLGIVQYGSPLLRQIARPYVLPLDLEQATLVFACMGAILDQVAAVHSFASGLSVAAPQIGIDRAAVIIRSPGSPPVTMLNPRILEESATTDDRYEGCLSFFDLRGMVPRPLTVRVAYQDVNECPHVTTFEHGQARLVAHEVDHLGGVLYLDRMRPGTSPIAITEYRSTDHARRNDSPEATT